MKRATVVVTGVLALLAARTARADSEDRARSAESAIASADRETAMVQAAVQRAQSQRPTPEQRLINGELLYRSKDHARASVVFSEIIEEFPDTPSAANALWLRGETYYAAGEYLSARRDYRQLVERGTQSRFSPYFARSLARLVDVSLRTGDLKGLDDVFSRLNQVPPAQVDAGLNYAKGKAYYARQDYGQAAQALQAVGAGNEYTHQARYFQGLVAMRTARSSGASAPGPDGTSKPASVNYKPAIDQFRQVTELAPDSPDHLHVIDLAWMAIGRLFYEMEQYRQASEAYSRVGRESPEFGTMLYELAWVYVRLGDVQRAERALEVLSVADPSSSFVGDGTLLRADLLLRAGAYDKALTLYEGVRAQYDPMRERVDRFLSSTSDVGVYYEKLLEQQLDALDQNESLPPLAVRWAREAEDGPAAFRVIDDVNQCKTLIRQSNALIAKLTNLIGSANRVRAFPELLAGQEKALMLLNQIARARLDLARGLDDEEPGELSGEVGEIRRQRRELMAGVQAMPATSAEFAERDRVGTVQWNHASQELTRRTQEVDQLQAVVNGLRRLLKEDGQRGVARDPATLERFNTEINENEHLLKGFQQQIAEIRQQIEFGRYQIGLGDARYQSDALMRANFRDLLEREVGLAAGGAAGGDAQKYASRVRGPLAQARAAEDRLTAAFAQIEAQVGDRIADLRGKIAAEKAKIDDYTQQLERLDVEGRDLVGRVALRNFTLVRDKLRGIVLRADVGITEQAWEVREEELERVRSLQTARAREEQLLDEELREVLDDAGDTAPVKK